MGRVSYIQVRPLVSRVRVRLRIQRNNTASKPLVVHRLVLEMCYNLKLIIIILMIIDDILPCPQWSLYTDDDYLIHLIWLLTD